MLFLIFGGLLVFTLAVPTMAASSDFLTQAQEAYSKYCTKSNSPLNQALGCYAFDKLSELEAALSNQSDTNTNQSNQIAALNSSLVGLDSTTSTHSSQISNLESTNTALQSQIDDLTNRVSNLEEDNDSLHRDIDEILNADPSTTEEVTIWDWGWRADGTESSVVDTNGHQLVVFKGVTQYEWPKLEVYYSDDQVNWQKQATMSFFQKNEKEVFEVYMLKGRYYKIALEIGGGNNFFYLKAILH